MRQILPVTWSADEKHSNWAPTPLRKLGHDEKFLEGVIAASPALLGVESFRHGFFGPFASFRAVPLESTQGKNLEADVVLLSASGHVVIVEVKLGDNEELRDRRVTAQVIDYATSLTRYEREELAELFGGTPGESLVSVVARHFSAPSTNHAELAETIYQRCRDGEVRVVIACDIAPDSAPALVKAMGLQASLGFEVKLVEIVPYTAGESREILFVPRDMAQTEVVATTRVVIEYKGTEQPNVAVVAPSAEAVAESVHQVKGITKRTWNEAAFLEDARTRLASDEFEAVKKLYAFTLNRATSIKWGKGATVGSANPRFAGVSERSPYTVWSDGHITLNYGWLNDNDATSAVRDALAERIQASLGMPRDLEGWPTQEVAEWKGKLEALLDTFDKTLQPQR